MIAALIASGNIAYVIILITLVEAALVLVIHRRTGHGLSPGAFLPNLIAGDFLLLALGVGLGHGKWGWVALCLLGSLVAHLTDLIRRWQ
ncbi:MAG: hypothetical protein B7Z78_10400 [Rhodospirillales bacterium 20-60-12]|nr:MAG: hypothetical protein B7Z78_10400 [Rhodospirillales bacterium 20-60-12]HQT68318.1 hypothetical protein [Acetobacteraceae bacterium]